MISTLIKNPAAVAKIPAYPAKACEAVAIIPRVKTINIYPIALKYVA